MSSEKFYLPKRLDDAPKFLLWPIDEALCFLVPLFFGMIVGLGFLTIIFAILPTYFWKKFKGKGGSNLVRALIYWYYPRSILDLKVAPDSSIKKYIS